MSISQIIEGVRAKKLEATLLFVEFSKAFDYIYRGKIEQIFPAHGPLKETVAAIMMLNKNRKVKPRLADGDTYLFDIVAGVLQADKLAPYMSIISLDYVPQRLIDVMKDNGFILNETKSRRYPAETLTYAYYANDVALLANTTTKA